MYENALKPALLAFSMAEASVQVLTPKEWEMEVSTPKQSIPKIK